MDRNTGLMIDGKQHLVQSFTVGITTPFGSRRMREWLGVDWKFQDIPATKNNVSLSAYEIILAFEKYNDPRIGIEQVDLVSVTNEGQTILNVRAQSFEGTGRAKTIEKGFNFNLAIEI